MFAHGGVRLAASPTDCVTSLWLGLLSSTSGNARALPCWDVQLRAHSRRAPRAAADPCHALGEVWPRGFPWKQFEVVSSQAEWGAVADVSRSVPSALPRPVCGCGSRDPTVCVLSLCFPAACGLDVSHRVGLWLHIRQILFWVLVSLPGPGTGTPQPVPIAQKGSGPWSRALGPLWVVVPSARAGMEHGGSGGSALETGLRRTLMPEGGGLLTPFPRLTRNLAVPTAVHATPFPFLKPGTRTHGDRSRAGAALPSTLRRHCCAPKQPRPFTSGPLLERLPLPGGRFSIICLVNICSVSTETHVSL